MELKKYLIRTLVFFSILCLLVITVIYFFNRKNDKKKVVADKYPEIPFFPNISNSNKFKNVQIDTSVITNIEQLKKINRIVITYRNDTIHYDSINLLLVTDHLKTLYYSKFEGEIYYDNDKKSDKIFVVNNVYFEKNRALGSKIGICQMINTKNGQKYNLKEIDKKIYETTKGKLKVIKHFTSYNGTEVCFFEDTSDNYYFVKNDLADEISKTLKLDSRLNFNFEVNIIQGGNPKIKNENIKLFDKILTDSKIRVHISYDINNHYSEEAEREHKQNEGYSDDDEWIEKNQLFYFAMKLKDNNVKFKSDLYYYSDFYFIELNKPKSDNDTLFYYCQNKIYYFCKK